MNVLLQHVYYFLREFNPHLPRSEILEVDSLRDKWIALTELAEKVRTQLLSEQRMFFEGEVDKQVKSFVVETIQFRNSFDTEGPLVPGLLPSEAVNRLGESNTGSSQTYKCFSCPSVLGWGSNTHTEMN